MRMTMVVIMAAKKTKPPNTPNAIMPPENVKRKSECYFIYRILICKKINNIKLPRLSCCVLDLLSFWTALTGTSALGPWLARTLAESGISLLIGNLGSGLDSGRGFLLMGLEISSITPKEFFLTFLYLGTNLGNIFGDIYKLDAFFRQTKSFRRFRLAFGFGLQTFYLIDFS